MPRIRTIKPSFWADDTVADLSLESRLLLIGLISFADDAGRFLASTAAIAGYLYPHDELPPVKLRRWLDEIEEKAGRMVVFYSVGGRRYGALLKYNDHQKINRAQPSSLPPPPAQFMERSVNGSVKVP